MIVFKETLLNPENTTENKENKVDRLMVSELG
jgi:hypothetical protein